ncbi:MAG: metabolite traffic protein EboE [Planctomycetota bacterium]
MSFQPSIPLSYCTNVHAGVDLDSIRANLRQYAAEVLQRLRGTGNWESLGVGLWIPDVASSQLLEGSHLADFAEFLSDQEFVALTINGFPFDNFHGDSVKQRVYLPSWAEHARFDYTCRLAKILTGLLPVQQTTGSISTLPIGWPNNPFAASGNDGSLNEAIIKHAGAKLRQLAEFLDALLDRTGKRIVVAIEPEPGCLLDTADDVVDFFEKELPKQRHREFITVCHDICHSVVMKESQRDAIDRYLQAGITVGKVQVSNAIVVPWDEIDEAEHAATLAELSGFAEDRYLHQTGCIDATGAFSLHDDLPALIRKHRGAERVLDQSWRIHFHVPIFVESFGRLHTSRSAVQECLAALSEVDNARKFTGHFEVETYAWTVLPPEWRQRGLAADIAKEMEWLRDQLSVQVSKNLAKR